jgi:pilus assembly protein Flp/PilA
MPEPGSQFPCPGPGAGPMWGYVDMKTFLKTFLADESGASAAEYALILAVLGVAIVAGAISLGGAIGEALSDAGECVRDGTATACS